MAEHSKLVQDGWPDDEVRALIARAQRGDEAAKETLVVANLRLVRSLVQRYTGSGQDPEDLFQLGCIGLVKAIDRFDLSLGLRFSTYAVPLVLGEIRRFIRDDGPLHVSRPLKQLGQQARRVRAELAVRLGRDPTVAEVAAALDRPVDAVVEALDGAREPASLDAVLYPGESDEGARYDQVGGGEPGESAWLDSLALQQGMARLDPRSRLLLKLRFFADKTQAETAVVLGISQVQVSRLERRAIAHVRSYMNDA